MQPPRRWTRAPHSTVTDGVRSAVARELRETRGSARRTSPAPAAFLLVGLFLWAPCGARALEGGATDRETAAVVALLHGARVFCSGMLVAPTVVLTAAHCFRETSDPRMLRVAFGETVGNAPMAAIGAVDVRLHPRFDPATFENDAALVLLAWAAPVAPIALSHEPPPGPGAALRVAGFGASTPGEPGRGRRRRSGTVRVVARERGSLLLEAPQARPCAGDSGGPLLSRTGGVENVVAFLTSGDEECAGSVRAALVDALAASFLEPYLAETALGSAEPGARCFSDAGCVRGNCFFPADAPRRGYCAPACIADGDCPVGMLCDRASRACRHPTPSPGALGARCHTPWDCGAGACAQSAPGTPPLCAQSCLGDAACGEHLTCLPNLIAPSAATVQRACLSPVRSHSDLWRLAWLLPVAAVAWLMLASRRVARRRREAATANDARASGYSLREAGSGAATKVTDMKIRRALNATAGRL